MNNDRIPPIDLGPADLIVDALGRPGSALPARFAFDKDNTRNGLGKLVLTLVELIRQLVERQAIRRVEAGSLTDVEVERLGITLMQLTEQMHLLKKHFGLEDEDLNIDLGPVGKLL